MPLDDGQRAVLGFLDKMEQVGQFQERFDLTADISRIWEAFLEHVRRLIRSEACALFLVDYTSHEFILKAAWPSGQEHLCTEELRLQIECGVFPWVINRRKPGVVPGLSLHGGGSVVLLPLFSPRQILGAAMVLSPLEESAFTQETWRLLAMLARQFSLVMENSILYENLRLESASRMTAQAKILKGEKLASLGRLSLGASHEILNPLHILSGYLHLLTLDKGISERGAHYVEVMKQQVDRISRIVKGLMQFARQDVEKRHLSLNGLLENAFSLLRQEISFERIEVLMGFEADLPPVLGNEENLLQAFYNILRNACEAMPGGGRLTVRTLRREGEGGPGGTEAWAEATIKDTGMGIPGSDLERIFDPFFTSKETGSGSGLGLSQSYGIVKGHEGEILVESAPDMGSTFLVQLPFAPGSPQKEEAGDGKTC